ncbi:MAG: hypothetical protein E6J00_13030 [Chloroflexi bacterium]|nr:MAG: hypothetical protein E6J00_13030 [Chloroflexota bacterium]
MVREAVWARLDSPGLEYLRLLDDDAALQAHGTVIGIAEGRPYALTYLLRWDLRWHVRSLRADCRSGDRLMTLDLESDGEGRWLRGGQPFTRLHGCFDVDIAATPFTNTLPIRRLRLNEGDTAEINVAYVDVPELIVEPARQRYTALAPLAGNEVYRYESVESGFCADLSVDLEGLVIDYPPLWRRVVPR